jgi:hypothetical protein
MRLTIRDGTAGDAPRLATLLEQLGHPASAQDIARRLELVRSSDGDRVIVRRRRRQPSPAATGRGERRVEPLADEDATAGKASHAGSRECDLRLDRLSDTPAACRHAEARHQEQDARHDVSERVRVERERFDAKRAESAVAARDSADLAEILSED